MRVLLFILGLPLMAIPIPEVKSLEAIFDATTPVVIRGMALKWPQHRISKLKNVGKKYKDTEVYISSNDNRGHFYMFKDSATGLSFEDTLAKAVGFPKSHILKSCFIVHGVGKDGEAHNHRGGFFVQNAGSRAVKLVAPEYASEILTDKSCNPMTEEECGTGINLFGGKSELSKLPQNAKVYEGIIEAGDVLFFPDRWFHQFEVRKAPSIRITCGFDPVSN